MNGQPFGIDFGGTGIKGAPVDLAIGDFAGERQRIDTPQPATPEAVADVFKELLSRFPDSTGPVGVTVPGILRRGVVHSVANIAESWLHINANDLFSEATGREVRALNDADAAGLAEATYGAAKDRDGLVLMATLGTGIGSALIYNGVLVPNSELGHLEIDGFAHIERRTANSAREREELSWEEWAERLTSYFTHVEMLFSPDLIVIGGGVSKKGAKFIPLIDIETPIVPATLQNRAGIVGAALWAAG
jgi:polyphosphate glucokinase